MVATQPLDIHDEKQLRQLEEELHIEILPGTEIMADFGTHHFVKETGSKGPVLVPQPSNNPHDPLNWTRKRKVLIISIANIFSFALGFGPLALAPQFGAYIEDFNSDLPGVIQFVKAQTFEDANYRLACAFWSSVFPIFCGFQSQRIMGGVLC
jgi:hypothetical protein